MPNKETDITKKERTKDDRPRRAIAWMVSNKDEMSFNEEKEKAVNLKSMTPTIGHASLVTVTGARKSES